jgi:quercetin dioxygenase-like cupin family protein
LAEAQEIRQMTKDSQTSARVVGRAEGDVVPFIGMVKAGAADTGGAFEIIDYTGPATPPPHIHRQHDEVFYVLRGRFTFTLGQEVVVADEGSTVLVPRGTRHGFTTDLDARALLITVPASLQVSSRSLERDWPPATRARRSARLWREGTTRYPHPDPSGRLALHGAFAPLD